MLYLKRATACALRGHPHGAQQMTPAYVYVPPGTSPLAAGVGAGIGQAIAIAILDAAPSARAKRTVRKINLGLDKESLDASLMKKIRTASNEGAVKVGNVDAKEFKRKTPKPQDKFKVVTSYTLAEDASSIRIQALVTYENDAISYQTPYDFGGKPPKNERKGPLYRNSFQYQF